MSQIILREKLALRHPILIVALAGWNDAGRSATIAAQQLISEWSAVEFAELDPDLFYVFSESRPWVQLTESGERKLSWPGVSFYAHRTKSDGLDVILLVGTEPALRWQAFCREIVEFARELGVSMVVTLGAFLAQVSHQDAVSISGWASPRQLHERLKEVEVSPISYEGPTGMITALSTAFAEAKMPIASLWAALPNYLGPTPNPKGALALVRCLDRAFGLGVTCHELVKASEQFERQVNYAVQRAKLMPGVALFQAEGESAKPVETNEASSSTSTVADLPTAEEAIRFAEDLLRQNRKS
jgi:proteasome assembly chaperone (PAC2) family protein